jgi:muconate cycloisomerase
VDCDAFPADTIGPFYHEGDVIARPLDLGPPHAKIPDGPGLGVELDEAAVKRWRVG